jgi:hypothetical protein
VEFHHYARFAEYWLSSGCDAGNDWCGGADLDQLGDVDGVNLGLFVNEWLYWWSVCLAVEVKLLLWVGVDMV